MNPLRPNYPDPNTTGYRFRVDYDYDLTGELSVAKDGNSPSTVYYALSDADALNRDLFVTLGNGLNEQRIYDRANGQLLSIDTGPGLSSSIQDLSFTWDKVGNLKSRVNAVGGSKTENFNYDPLDRLTSAQVTGLSAVTMAYSAAGRITAKSDVPGTWTYGAGPPGPNALTSVGSTNYNYDLNGRMTTHGTDAFTWWSFDQAKQLAVGTKTAEFFYGVDRQRYKQIQKTSGATNNTIWYAGSLYEREVATSTTTYRNHVSARGRTVATVSRTGTTNTARYLHRDQQSSVVEVTGSTGTLIQSLAFDAWGLRRNPANWAALASPFGGSEPTERGYTGHEHLDKVELIHMNGRVQDPKLGRFISADPFVQAPYHSQSLNRYSYVWNNPLTLVDPSGFGGWRCDDDGRCSDGCELNACENEPPCARYSYDPFGVCMSIEEYRNREQWDALTQYLKDSALNNQLTWFESFSTRLDLPSIPRVDYDNWLGQLNGVSFGLSTPIASLIHGEAIVDIASPHYQSGQFWMGVGYGVLTAGAGAVSSGTGVAVGAGRTAGSIRNVNPLGSTTNCVNCAIATDATLAGRPASALASGPASVAVLEGLYGGQFARASGQAAIEAQLLNAGNGARGIVFGSRGAGQVGHVFNAVNQGGSIRFLDGQSGAVASFEGYAEIFFLRTF